MESYRLAQLVLTEKYNQVLVNLVDASRRAAAWIVLGTILSTAGLLAYTVTHLSLDTDPLNLLDPHLPFRELKSDFQQAFPQLMNLIVVVVDADNPDAADHAAENLARELEHEKGLFRFVYQPGKDPFFERNGLLYLDTPDLWKLDERLTKWEPFLGTLTRDPSIRGLFSMLEMALDNQPDTEQQTLFTQAFDVISDSIEAQLANQPSPLFWQKTMFDEGQPQGNNNRRFLLVQPRIDYSSLRAVASPLEELRQFAKQAEAQPGVRVRLTGSVPMEEEERDTLSQGMKTSAILSFTLVCVILFLGFRSSRLVWSLLMTLVVGLVWTGALATVVIGSLNMISAAAPVLFIGLGVDFGIQFGMRYTEAIENGVRHELALQRAASEVGGALTLAALAAALSFFSFFPTAYRGLAELGLIAGMGMFVAFFANLTFLPALLTILPFRSNPQTPKKNYSGNFKFSVVPHRHMILWVSMPATVAAVALLPSAQFDFNPLSLKDPSTEAVETFKELLNDPNTTPYTIQILAPNLEAGRQLKTRLKHLEEVEKVVSLTSFVPKDQEEKLTIIDDMAFVLQPIIMPVTSLASPSHEERTQIFHHFQEQLSHVDKEPFNEKLIASMGRLTLLLDRFQLTPGWPDTVLDEFERRVLGDLPKKLERLEKLMTARHVTLKDLPADLRERYVTPDGRYRLEVFPANNVSDNQILRRFVRAVQAVAPNAIGTDVALVEAGNAIVNACLQATGLALISVTLLLYIALRRMRDTILVLIPVVLTLIFTIAASVAFNLPLNMANVVALPLMLGLGVAFGIYLVLRRREGIDIENLVNSSTSRAVIFSALTTMASFGTLAFSNHRGMFSMGVLLTFTLALALVCALVVLPALMAEMEKRGWG